MEYNYPGLLRFELVKSTASAAGTTIYSLKFTILAQHQSILNRGTMAVPEFKTSSGVRVGSYRHPELADRYIALLGSDESINNDTRYFKSSMELNEYHDNALAGIAEFAKNYGAVLQSTIPEQEQLSLWD